MGTSNERRNEIVYTHPIIKKLQISLDLFCFF